MKKIGLHLDALIAIIVVFLLAFSIILYQRYQFSGLLQENIDLAWENANLNVNLEYTTGLLDKCNNNKDSEDARTADDTRTSPTD